MLVTRHPILVESPVAKEFARQRDGSSRVIIAFFLTIALPPEISFEILGLNLNPARLFLLFVFPIALTRLIQDPDFVPRDFDYAISFSILWTWIAIGVNEGFEKGFAFGGSFALDGFGSYLLARAYIRSLRQFEQAVRAYLITVVIAGVFALLDVMTGIYIVHETAAALMGMKIPVYVDASYAPRTLRYGLLRPFSIFDHPIHYGVFCATIVGMVYFMYQETRSRWLRFALVCLAVVISLSSGPYMGMALAIALCGWEKVTQRVPHRVLVSVGVVLVLLMAAKAVLNRSLTEVFISFTLDPATAYYRLFIWEYGTAAVLSNPLFGLKVDTWQKASFMSFSIDNFWLYITMQAGLPMLAALALGLVQLLVRVNNVRTGPRPSGEKTARYAWTTALIVISVQGVTVHYWGQLYMFFFFLAGMGAWMTAKQTTAQTANAHVMQGPWVIRDLVSRQPMRLVQRQLTERSARRAPVR